MSKKVLLKNQNGGSLLNSYPTTILLILITEAVKTFEGGKISEGLLFMCNKNEQQKKSRF